MSLIEQVKETCDRLEQHGWGELFREFGLEIKSDPNQPIEQQLEQLERELLRPLNIPPFDAADSPRRLKGFEDFAPDGDAAITPGKQHHSKIRQQPEGCRYPHATVRREADLLVQCDVQTQQLLTSGVAIRLADNPSPWARWRRGFVRDRRPSARAVAKRATLDVMIT